MEITKQGIKAELTIYKEKDGKLLDVDQSFRKELLKNIAKVVKDKGFEVQITATSVDVTQREK